MPAAVPFTAGPEWQEVVVPWTALGLEPKDVMGLVFAGGPAPRAFSFRLDDVRIR